VTVSQASSVGSLTPVPIPDASFESVQVGTGIQGFKYNPVGSAWSFNGNAGLAANGSGFTAGNPPAPDGTQVAFLQTTGSMSQAVNLAAGSYTVSFVAAQRQNLSASPNGQTFQVLIDGQLGGNFNPSSTSYTSLSTSTFTLSAGPHTILFRGTNLNGGDNTAFIDQVQLLFSPSPPPPPADGSFENVTVGTGPSAYKYNPAGSAWIFDGSSGLAGNSSAFTATNPPAPNGTQVAFLQTLGTMRQAVNLAAGSYTMSFSAAQRQNSIDNPQQQTFQVLVDGQVVGSFSPVGANYTIYNTSIFSVTAGLHTILFRGTNLKGGDNTAFIDQVQVLLASPPPPFDGSFESPNLGTGLASYRYNPVGTAWTFDGGSGLTGNSTSFTFGNPPAPDGNQVAFLQTLGTMRQAVNLAAGSYTVTFSAAQRQNFIGAPLGETFQVLVDGAVVGNFNPVGGNYASFTTSSLPCLPGFTLSFLEVRI